MHCREMLFAVTVILIYSAAGQAVTDLTSDCYDFSSPNHPNNYPNNLAVSWKITVSTGFRVKLRFTSFNVKRQGRRCPDSVAVYDGSSSLAPMIGTYCGSRSGLELTSTGNTMFVSLTTDESRSLSGFYAEYDAISGTGDLNIATGSPNRCSTVSGPCGQPAITPRSSRVVGGEEATPHSWPWQVLLTSSSTGTSSQFCGGSLLNDRWVLTAAHCVDRNSPGSLYIKSGAHNRYSTTEGAVVSRVSRIIVHPSYNSRKISYDYALVELDQRDTITFTDKMSPVCLPTSGENFIAGSLVTTTGWGALTETGSSPDLLQQVNLKLYSDARCSELPRNSYDSRSMMCAGVDAGGKGSCYGDSGGPLVIQRDGKYKLIGVVSWGFGCARVDRPGVYAKVSAVLGWINGYIG